ncbi:hypothetical protein ABES23_21065 [Peribacillus frigoritolerans]|uniref:hypothetical protein n=1 Tax=Peribacillus frigoritolerans TaxID=450367 RepID=UPI003D2E6C42
MEYQKAAAPTVIRTINICSGPYATEDKASEDNIANAFVLLSFCSPSAFDFKGLPIKNLFIEDNIKYSPPY